jgi:DNA-binding GntR family transcriptional regulator
MRPVETPRNIDSSGRHRQLSEKVANQIRESIMVGELKPGFLRTERLAEDLGVSPTPVREALMILQAEGAVQWEPRRGFRLIPMTAQDVADLYEVQAYIAGELAARAAVSLSAEQVDRLESIQAELQEAARVGNVELVDNLNHEIHRTINTASGSVRMTTLLRQTVQYVPLGFFGRIDGWAGASAHDHSAIFTALRKRNKSAARKAMAEHIRHIGSLLLEHLKSQDVLQ